MSDIFREVEEDVRRERYEKLWKKYGYYFIAAAAAMVLGVAGYQAWQNYDISQRQSASDQYAAAAQLAADGNPSAAVQALLPLTQGGPGGYGTLAKFQLASVYLMQADRQAAASLLRELTADSDSVIAYAARLRLAWTLAEVSPKSEVEAVVQPLTGTDSPWRFAAAEVLAYMDFKEGATDQAAAAFTALGEELEAPASLRQRASALSEYLKANAQAGAAPGANALQGTNP